MRDGGADGCSLSPVVLPHEHDAVTALAPPLGEVPGAVGRAVVDDDDLLVEVERPDRVEHVDDRRRLVVGRHQEGHPHGGGA